MASLANESVRWDESHERIGGLCGHAITVQFMSSKDLVRRVKYVFCDVVGYSRNRTAEAQIDIIDRLNEAVTRAVNAWVSEQIRTGVFEPLQTLEVIYIPTGDGICVAIVDREASYDAHIRIALGLLYMVDKVNAQEPDESRKFSIRIGLAENDDNMITDINEKRNVAGPGINEAQRAMSFGDGSQILFGESVFNVLRHRESYVYSIVRFEGAEKHGRSIFIYQLISQDGATYPQLSSEVPSAFAEPEHPISKRLRERLAEIEEGAPGPFSTEYMQASSDWDLEILKELTHLEQRAEAAHELEMTVNRLTGQYADLVDALCPTPNPSYARLLAAIRNCEFRQALYVQLSELNRLAHDIDLDR